MALDDARWPAEWDIPTLDFGHPVTAEEIHQVVAEASIEAGNKR